MKRRQSRKPVRNRPLGLEQLESRVVLDGNVRAFLSGGVLRVIGDSRANEITITQQGLRSFTLESRDGNTTINGQAGPRRFTGVRDDLNISLGSGNDVIEIVGTAVDAVTVSDRLFVNTGNGSDQVLFTEVHAIGVHINTGSGNDIINVGQDGGEGGLEVTKEAILLTGSGRDEAVITNSFFKRFLTLDMGSNDDETTLLETRVRRSSVVLGGAGFDTLNREGNSGSIRYISYNRTRNTVDSPPPLPPVAANDTAAVVRGGNVTVNVASNDTSGSGSLNLGSIAITQQPTSGSVVVNANGTITYTNNGAAATSDSFQYTIRNQQGTLSNVATVNITVADSLAAVNDAGAVTEDATPNTATGNVLTNDTGGVGTKTVTAVNGTAASVGVAVQRDHGTFSITSAGQYTYTLDNNDADLATLDAGETITDTITYTTTAGGQTSTATLTITITGVNETPLAAVNDAGGITEDATPNTTTGNVLTNDTGGSGTKTVTAVNGAAGSVGAVVQRDHGTFSITSTGQYTYTLDNNDPDLATLDATETITDTITYTVSAGGQTSTATLTITITGVNDTGTLTAVNDTGGITEDATPNTTTGNVLANDTGGTGTKTVTAVNGAAASVGAAVQRDHGTFSITSAGQFTYTLDNSDPDLATLNAGQVLTDTITYTASAGGQTSTATLTITITGVNEPTSLAAVNDTGGITEDATPNTTTGNVLTNDTGGTGTKTVTAVNGAAGSVGAVVQRNHGTFSITSTGQYTYTLDNNDPDLATLDATETITDTITYTASAGGQTSTATLTITITGVNDTGTLTAINDTGAITEDATPNTTTGNVLGNDTGGSGTKTVTAVNGAAGSVGAAVQRDHGTFNITSTGQFTYTLDNNDPDLATLDATETITDTITYTASAGGQTSTATLTITITGVNDTGTLTAVNDTGGITEDATPNTTTGNVLANDTGGTGTKTVTAVNGAAGSVGAAVQRDHGTFSITSTGQYTYTLNNNDPDLATLDAGETLTDTITYTASAGGQTSTATLTITITGVNDTGTLAAVNDTGGITEDATPNTTTGNVLTNDTGGSGTKTVSAVNGAAASVGAVVQRDHGTFSITSTGQYTYTLDNNDADLLTLDAGETLTDTISYTASAGGQTSTATLTITITGVNDTGTLTAINDAGAITEDATPNTTSGNVLANDTGGAGTKTVSQVNGSAASVGAVVQGDHGSFSITATGQFTYTLNNADDDLDTLDAGETLTDTMIYTASVGGQTSTATLTITISGVNEDPLAAVADSGEVTEDASTNTATGDVLANDTGGVGSKAVTEVAGSAAGVGAVVQGDHGTFSITSGGQYTYTLDNSDPDLATLNAGQELTDTITYEVTAGSETSTTTLTITIQGANEPPPVSAVADTDEVTEDSSTTTATGNVLDNDTGGTPSNAVTRVNGLAGNVGATINGNFGTFSINADGTYTYTLDNGNTEVNNLATGATLQDQIGYTVGDGNTTSDSTLTITIEGNTDP